MRNRLIVVIIPLVLAFFLILFREQLLLAIGKFLIVEDELQPADVIHVIAGEDHRLDYAIQLYQQGFGRQIYLTGGGWCSTHHVIHGEALRKQAVEQGVPLAAIVIDDAEITSTFSEVVRLKAWIDQNPDPVRSVIVVSDPFHMHRARWAYRKVLGKNIDLLMAPVPFEQTPYEQRWWENWESKRYVKEEYQKFLYYIVRYQLSWGPLKEWLASFDSG